MLLGLLTLLVFLLILSVLVLIHEAGHYFVAKKLGIKVEEFGFGFPLTPPLFSKKHGETIYSFYPVLIGGFVKLYGEDEAGAGRIEVKKKEENKKEDEKRAFYSRPIWQRTAVVIAGIVMNTLLAVVIYYAFLGISNFKTELPLIGQHTFFLVNQKTTSQIVISEVSKDSPAEKLGLKEFSRIISVNGMKVAGMDMFSKIIKDNRGKEIVLEWEDMKSMKKYKGAIIPRSNPPKNQGALGVAFFPVDTVMLSYDTPVQKALSGFTHPANLMTYNFSIMKSLIDLSIKEKNPEPISQGVSGPVGIYSLVGTIIDIPDAKERILQILNLAGILSISLAFFNVLPIPGLDGGRLFFIVIEAVTRRKVDPKIEGYAHMVGMILLIALIMVVTFKDILQLFK